MVCRNSVCTPGTRLELHDARASDGSGDHITTVDRLSKVATDQAKKFLRIVEWLFAAESGLRSWLAPVQVGHHLPAHPQRIHLVFCEIVAEARHLGVQLRAAEDFVVAFFAGCHLDERGTGQEYLRLFLDEDVVVGETRLVGPTGGRRPEYDTHERNVHLREFDHLVEESATFREVSRVHPPPSATTGLHPQIGARRFDEADVGHTVVTSNLERPLPFLAGIWRQRTAKHRRIVRQNHTFGPGYHTDSEQHPATDRVVGIVTGKCADLEERGVRVEDIGDTLADRHLAAASHSGNRSLAAPTFSLYQQLIDHVELFEHVGAVLLVGLA